MQIVIRPPAPAGYMETVMFARPTAEVNMFINQRNQELHNRLTQYYGAAGQEFLQSSQTFHEEFRKNAGLEAAEQIVLMSNNALASNSGYLVPLQTVEELQGASGRYLTYLMANPNVTQLYYDNRIDGYGELFLDPEPKLVGENRNAYRAVVSGVGTSYYNYDHEEAENETWITYSNNESDEGMPLLSQEQYNVINAWKLQDLAIDDNIDPTSIDGFEIRK